MSNELISNSFDDRYENEEVAKFCIDNEDRLYIDEPYDIEAFANSISCSNISMAPNFIGYIGGVKLFEYLTNVKSFKVFLYKEIVLLYNYIGFL